MDFDDGRCQRCASQEQPDRARPRSTKNLSKPNGKTSILQKPIKNQWKINDFHISKTYQKPMEKLRFCKNLSKTNWKINGFLKSPNPSQASLRTLRRHILKKWKNKELHTEQWLSLPKKIGK